MHQLVNFGHFWVLQRVTPPTHYGTSHPQDEEQRMEVDGGRRLCVGHDSYSPTIIQLVILL